MGKERQERYIRVLTVRQGSRVLVHRAPDRVPVGRVPEAALGITRVGHRVAAGVPAPLSGGRGMSRSVRFQRGWPTDSAADGSPLSWKKGWAVTVEWLELCQSIRAGVMRVRDRRSVRERSERSPRTTCAASATNQNRAWRRDERRVGD